MRTLSLRALVTAVLVSLLCLAGCDREDLTPLDTATAESYIDLLRTHRFDQIQNDMSPDLRSTEAPGTLSTMAGMFPAGSPLSVKIVGADTLTAPDLRSTALTLEYEFPGKWLLADVTTQEANQTESITALHITPIPESLEQTNRFSLWGKTELEYDTLMFALLSVLVSLYAFVTCLLTPLRRGKWFWLILTLVGLGGFGINWTTGDCASTLLVLRLPVVGGSAPVYGPCMIYVALPVGAALFLILRKRLMSYSSTEPPREILSIPKWLP